MPDPNDSFGYQPPKFFNDTLTLDPQLAAVAPADPVLLGWHLQSRLSQSPLHLGLTYGDLDDGLAPYLSFYSTLTASQPNQPTSALLTRSVAGLSLDSDLLDKIRDAVGDAAQDKFWPKIYVPKFNYANGQPATIGSIDPAGTPHYDGPDKVVPGTALTLPFSLSKRFPYASGNDVHFKLYLDKDAIDGNRPAALVSGAAIEVQGKTSDGMTHSLTIIGGRGMTGGPAGAVIFEIKFGGPKK